MNAKDTNQVLDRGDIDITFPFDLLRTSLIANNDFAIPFKDVGDISLAPTLDDALLISVNDQGPMLGSPTVLRGICWKRSQYAVKRIFSLLYEFIRK